MAWTREDAAHLLRRAGFGGSLGEVDRTFALGQTAAVDALVDFERTSDPIWSNNNPLGVEKPDEDSYQYRGTLVYRMLASKRPLQTKLLWFWHGHFTTSLSAVDLGNFRKQMQLYRANAVSGFGAFLAAMYKDGAMLQYLNGSGSSKYGPNENFARESMELYTTGSGPYTERDVREAARALTGWEVTYPEQLVRFDNERHDNGTKTILGQTGNFNGEDFMRILAARPETARRITSKLYRFFVSERLNVVEQSRLLQSWGASTGSVRTVMRTLLNAPSFWDPRNRGTVVKSVFDFGLGLLQRFEIVVDRDRANDITNRFGDMGQHPCDPPNPAGYRTGLRLAGASMLLERCQFAAAVIYDWSGATVIGRFNSGLPVPVAPAALVDQVAVRLGSMPLTANTRNAILAYLGTTPIGGNDLADRTRDVAFLIACSPEYQVM